MNSLIVLLLTLAVAVSVANAGMDCGIAGNCPNVANKIGDALTGDNSGKAYCCKTDVASIPYCCTITDYANYKWDRFVNGAESGKVVAATTIGAALLAVLL